MGIKRAFYGVGNEF